MMESPSSSELPRITKRELKRVGIELRFEDNVRDWMRRGWFELDAYRCRQAQFQAHIERRFEEDGA